MIQSLEFVAETRILAEIKIKNRGKYILPGKKYRHAYLFFSMKIKMMVLWMQIEGTKLMFVMNVSVLHFFKFASRMAQIAQILVSTPKIFPEERGGGEGGEHAPGPRKIFTLLFIAIPGSVYPVIPCGTGQGSFCWASLLKIAPTTTTLSKNIFLLAWNAKASRARKIPYTINYDNSDNNNNNNNNNNERISRAPFHVKHAQLHWTGANTKIQNTCI